MERVQLQPAYILHHYPYRDSSLLIEAFTRVHGRVGLVARGVRRPKSKLKAVLQPFQPVLLSWSARGDLGTLSGAESSGAAHRLTGSRLMCGFYVNELLLRLLHRHDPHPDLFGYYLQCLTDLAGSSSKQAVLRLFEKRLLTTCGYGLHLTTDIDSGKAVREDVRYQYMLEMGPRENLSGSGGLTVSGATLLALEEDRLEDGEVLREAGQLLRAAIDLYLGGKPLKTRQVLRDMRQSK